MEGRQMKQCWTKYLKTNKYEPSLKENILRPIKWREGSSCVYSRLLTNEHMGPNRWGQRFVISSYESWKNFVTMQTEGKCCSAYSYNSFLWREILYWKVNPDAGAWRLQLQKLSSSRTFKWFLSVMSTAFKWRNSQPHNVQVRVYRFFSSSLTQHSFSCSFSTLCIVLDVSPLNQAGTIEQIYPRNKTQGFYLWKKLVTMHFCSYEFRTVWIYV